MRHNEHPVVVIGAGPTGLMLTHLLATYGIATRLIERAEATVDEARAVSIDDESLRTVQAVGMGEQVLPSISQGYGVEYYSWRNRLFARIDPTVCENGWQKRNAFRQQVFLRQLREGLKRYPHVDVRFGHELKSFAQDADGVTLHLLTHGGLEQLRCQWLVACDGGRSGVRESLGIALEGNTFGERWLIVDLLDRTTPFRHTRTYCDPVRPAIRLPGPDGTVRYEFMLHDGEDPEQALDEERLREWIHQREPSDARLPIARKVVYTFHARVAQRWREGRVFLAGDAAHLTPPFAGQGMNSGVRDVVNLAWKLAAVIEARLSDSVLASYEQERKPHAWALIRMALRIGQFMQPKSRMGAAFNQTALRAACLLPAARDYVLQLRFKPKPRFNAGFFVPAAHGPLNVTAGQLLPQPRVELPGGRICLLDELLGHDFSVLRLTGTPPVVLPEGLESAQFEILSRNDDFIALDQSRCIRDVDDVLIPMLDAAQARALVLRPDRYIYAFVPLQVCDESLSGVLEHASSHLHSVAGTHH